MAKPQANRSKIDTAVFWASFLSVYIQIITHEGVAYASPIFKAD